MLDKDGGVKQLLIMIRYCHTADASLTYGLSQIIQINVNMRDQLGKQVC